MLRANHFPKGIPYTFDFSSINTPMLCLKYEKFRNEQVMTKLVAVPAFLLF